ncbi:Uma2 family endonuclease [Azospirillum sp. sgz302134]
MSEPARKTPRMTVAEFVEWDDGSGIDYELYLGEPVPRHIRYINGRPVAQAAASAEHAAIVANVGGELRNRLRPPCRAFSDAGVARPDDDRSYFKPDVLVSCTQGRIPGWIVPNPVFIVEVLSRGTASFDEGAKLSAYCALPSVQAILFVETGKPQARLVRRNGDHWELDFLNGLEASVRVDSLDLELPMAEIYRGVVFEE